MVEILLIERGWVTLNANFIGKGRPPPTNFGIRKLGSLGYRMVNKIAENFNWLSRAHAHQRHRQTTDDRRQTDGSAIAYSERKREFTSAKNHCISSLTMLESYFLLWLPPPMASASTAWDFSQDLGILGVDLGLREFAKLTWDFLTSTGTEIITSVFGWWEELM